MDFIIRKAQLSDLDGIRNVFSDSWIDEMGKIQTEEVNAWASFVEQSLKGEGKGAEEKHHYLVAENSGNILGIQGYREYIHPIFQPFIKTSHPIEAYNLFVLKNFRGKGIGKALVEEMIRNSKEENFTEIVFVSAERWKDAWTFHDKMGFTGIAAIPKEFGTLIVYRMEF